MKRNLSEERSSSMASYLVSYMMREMHHEAAHEYGLKLTKEDVLAVMAKAQEEMKRLAEIGNKRVLGYTE